MSKRIAIAAAALCLGAAMVAAGASPAGAEPKRGGILNFVVPDEPPSFDGHKETTFALIHPIAPFYSVLIRVDPNNPASLTDYVCDLCTSMPSATDDGTSYTFKIRKDVKFHDGTKLSAKDVLATFQRIIFPTEGVSSARKSQYPMVASVTSPDDETVTFKLKYPSGAFIPSLANPYNFIYSKAKLDADPKWYESNVMGSGPFIFETREAGARITGKRNPDYYHKGLPYLDGFEAIFAKKQALRVQAIRGDQAAIEFRSFPPKSRDDLVAALGKDVTVQESNWNCGLTSLNPEFIVCDEAISALDVSIQAQVINLLEDLRSKLGLTYLFIAHDLSVVRHISHRVAVMYLGRVVEMAPSDEIFERPQHPYTRALINAVPTPDPDVEMKRVHAPLQGEVPSPMHPPSGCVFHPRCQVAVESCRRSVPELREIAPGHQAACTQIGSASQTWN